MNWCQLGDRNTKFFHSYANQRRKKNNVQQIIDDHNMRLTSPEELERAFKGFFDKLLTSFEPSIANIDKCLKNMESCVSSEMNDNLSKTFTRVDVEEAIN